MALMLLKSSVLILCSAYIIYRLDSIKGDLLSISTLFVNQHIQFWILMACVMLLAPLNWFFEVVKWRLLTSHIQQLNVSEGFKSVFAGITFGFATPRAIGDYIGRMLVFSNENKSRVIFPLFLGRASQILPTLLFGLIGIYVLANEIELGLSIVVIPIALLGISILALTRFKRIRRAGIKIIAGFGLNNYKTTDISRRTIYQVISYSFLRYLVFSFQFFLVMLMFEVEASSFMIVAGITWIFFAKSMIPSFSFLSDLGIREFSAILYFETFQVALIPVLSASLFIWLINIALPAIAGLLSVQSSKV